MRHGIPAYLVHFKFMIYEVSFWFGFCLRSNLLYAVDNTTAPLVWNRYVILNLQLSLPFSQYIMTIDIVLWNRDGTLISPLQLYSGVCTFCFGSLAGGLEAQALPNHEKIFIKTNRFHLFLIFYYNLPLLNRCEPISTFIVSSVCVYKNGSLFLASKVLVTKKTNMSVKFQIYWICSPPTRK